MRNTEAMSSERFFALLASEEPDRDLLPYVQACGEEPEKPWMVVLDRHLHISHPDLVLAMPHRQQEHAAIRALRSMGFAERLTSSTTMDWQTVGCSSSGPLCWSARLAPASYPHEVPISAEVRVVGLDNGGASWSAVGATPARALWAALRRARAGLAILAACALPAPTERPSDPLPDVAILPLRLPDGQRLGRWATSRWGWERASRQIAGVVADADEARADVLGGYHDQTPGETVEQRAARLDAWLLAHGAVAETWDAPEPGEDRGGER